MSAPRIELPQFSMFASTPVYSVNGTIVYGLMTPVVVPDPTDELWQVPAGGVPRLDLLSNAFYGTPALFHVLASVNDCIDPLVGIPQGTLIRVPTKQRLAAEGILNA